MKKIKYDHKELNALLIREIQAPMVAEKYKRILELHQEEPGSHVVYGDVLNPYILKCLDEKNELELYKIFNFIEMLCVQGDPDVKNVIAVSVIESIEDSPSFKNYGIKFIGPNTKKLLWAE